MVEEASYISLHSPSRPEDIPTAQPIWQALRERRRIHRLRLANPASLRLIAAYASANRALKHASATHKLQVKEHRRQRTLSAVSEISLALMPNPRLSYHRLKVLAPWDPQPLICLKHPSGRVLTPEEGLHMLQDFGHTVFARDSDLPAASFPLPPLNSSSLAKQIRSIQPHKAVPEGSAPSSV